jgi:hypothetical protein
MNWLKKDPGSVRSAPGLEWALWRRLPAIFGWGTALPALLLAWSWWSSGADQGLARDPDAMRHAFVLIGVIVLHWTLVLTLAIGCAIVLLMKGPRYEADPYPLPDADRPRD